MEQKTDKLGYVKTKTFHLFKETIMCKKEVQYIDEDIYITYIKQRAFIQNIQRTFQINRIEKKGKVLE